MDESEDTGDMPKESVVMRSEIIVTPSDVLLEELMSFVRREEVIARKQAREARNNGNARLAELHETYSKAMRKVKNEYNKLCGDA